LATVVENFIKIAFTWLAKKLEEIWKSDNSAHNEYIKKRNPSAGLRIKKRAPAGGRIGEMAL
jgi:hypothetical protein